MKRSFLFIVILMALPVHIYAQNAIFQKYATLQDVKYVSISHTMLTAMSSKKNVHLGNMQLSEVLDYIDNVLIISAVEPSSMTIILNDLSNLQTDKRYTPLLEKNINGQRDISFFREGTDSNEFVLFTLTDTYTIIILSGHFTPEQFQSLFL